MEAKEKSSPSLCMPFSLSLSSSFLFLRSSPLHPLSLLDITTSFPSGDLSSTPPTHVRVNLIANPNPPSPSLQIRQRLGSDLSLVCDKIYNYTKHKVTNSTPSEVVDMQRTIDSLPPASKCRHILMFDVVQPDISAATIYG